MTSQPVTQEQLSLLDAVSTSGWRTVVHNDPVNLMSYVQWVFESYFKMDERTAYAKMMQVHERGKAVVSHGPREQMEVDAQAMHGYGLWATISKEDL